MNEPKYFIVIDDDAINNKICRTVIEKIYNDTEVNTFTDPIAGFEFIVSEYSNLTNDKRAILFLDINMPVMDAWEFLNLFDKLDANLRTRITIFILSSSVNKSDMERAMSNRNVSYYLIKPLTKESIKLISNLAVRKKHIGGEAGASTHTQPASTPNPNVEPAAATAGSMAEVLQQKKEAEERDAKLSAIKVKDELVHREIPELEREMNSMLFNMERKYKDAGLWVEPITATHAAFDKKKGGKLQLNIHFFEHDKDGLHHFRDASAL